MNREYTELEYRQYMRVINKIIIDTENSMQLIEKWKKVSTLTHEQWVQWQDGKLSLDDIKIDGDDKGL